MIRIVMDLIANLNLIMIMWIIQLDKIIGIYLIVDLNQSLSCLRKSSDSTRKTFYKFNNN